MLINRDTPLELYAQKILIAGHLFLKEEVVEHLSSLKMFSSEGDVGLTFLLFAVHQVMLRSLTKLMCWNALFGEYTHNSWNITSMNGWSCCILREIGKLLTEMNSFTYTSSNSAFLRNVSFWEVILSLFSCYVEFGLLSANSF